MSVGRIEECGTELMRHGLAASTPAAMVENGTTSRQRVVHSTLREIARDVRRAGIASPALLFVGETVALGRKLQWFDGDPAGEACDAWQPRPVSARRALCAGTHR
jgi:siroheme synthase